MIDIEEKKEKEALDKDALTLRQRKDRISKRFKSLKNSDSRTFQRDFVRLQAKEICNYVKDMSMSPLKAWHGDLKNLISDGVFMEKYYLTLNEYNEIVPDTKKIDSLILPEPLTEEEIRGSGTMDFE